MAIRAILSQSYVLAIKFNSFTVYLLTIFLNNFVAMICWAKAARSFSGKKAHHSSQLLGSTRATMFECDLSCPCHLWKQVETMNRPAPPSIVATSVQLNHESQNMYLHNLTVQHGGVNWHPHCCCEVSWSVLESYLAIGLMYHDNHYLSVIHQLLSR